MVQIELFSGGGKKFKPTQKKITSLRPWDFLVPSISNLHEPNHREAAILEARRAVAKQSIPKELSSSTYVDARGNIYALVPEESSNYLSSKAAKLRQALQTEKEKRKRRRKKNAITASDDEVTADTVDEVTASGVSITNPSHEKSIHIMAHEVPRQSSTGVDAFNKLKRLVEMQRQAQDRKRQSESSSNDKLVQSARNVEDEAEVELIDIFKPSLLLHPPPKKKSKKSRGSVIEEKTKRVLRSSASRSN